MSRVIFQIGRLWPVVLILIGVLMLQRRLAGPKSEPPTAPADPSSLAKRPDEPSNISDRKIEACGAYPDRCPDVAATARWSEIRPSDRSSRSKQPCEKTG